MTTDKELEELKHKRIAKLFVAEVKEIKKEILEEGKELSVEEVHKRTLDQYGVIENGSVDLTKLEYLIDVLDHLEQYRIPTKVLTKNADITFLCEEYSTKPYKYIHVCHSEKFHLPYPSSP